MRSNANQSGNGGESIGGSESRAAVVARTVIGGVCVALLLGLLGLVPSVPTAWGSSSPGVADDTASSAADANPDGTRVERPPLTQRIVEEGVEVTLTIRPLDGSETWVVGREAEVTYTIRDAASGEPITGLHPLSWIHRRATALPPTPEELQERISTFLGGLLSVRADVDMNRYFLLVLNGDATISVIDPLIEFSKTKLYSLVQLQGPGEAWLLDETRERLYVSVPSKARIEAIDLTTFRSVGFVEVGEGLAPRDLVLEPDGDVLWVGLDTSNAVVAIDTAEMRVLDRVRVGVGMHRLALSSDGTVLCATSSGSGEVAIVDLASRAVVHSARTGERPYAVRHSPASGLFYVAHAVDPTILAIDPETGSVRATIETEGPHLALDLDPSGRFLFACDLENSAVTIIDVSTHAAVGTIRGAAVPDHVAFTENFAYIRSVASPSVTLIDTARLQRGEIVRTDLVVGRLPAKDAPTNASIARMIAPTPERTSVMVANPADQLIYYYAEGMMASMGNFQTYGRVPRGVAILDRSLRETAPGVYSTVVRPVVAGRSDVPFVVDQPRVLHGFEVEIEPAPDAEATPTAAPVTIASLFADERFTVGETRTLRVQVLDSAEGTPVAGLGDVQVIVIRGQGVQQDRYIAREVEPGTYAFTHTFPARDRYQVLFAVPSRGGTFRDLPMFTVPVLNPDEGSPWDTPKRPARPKGSGEATPGGGRR